jgi:thiol:disulfide interchange protein DsbD
MKFTIREFRKMAGAALLVLALATAGCGPRPPDDAHPVQVAVETDLPTAVPGGRITLVWRLKIAPGWHLYWPGRNDSGFAPRIDLELPAGWLAGGLQWPAPERHVTEGEILDHVYYDELVLLQVVSISAAAPALGGVALQGQVEWLACKDSCVPGKATVPVTIAMSSARGQAPSAVYEAARERLPQPLPEGLLATGWDGAAFRVSGEPGSVLTFMPSGDCGELVNLLRDGQGEQLALRFQLKNNTVGPVRGLITIKSVAGPRRAYIVDFPAEMLPATPVGSVKVAKDK